MAVGRRSGDAGDGRMDGLSPHGYTYASCPFPPKTLFHGNPPSPSSSGSHLYFGTAPALRRPDLPAFGPCARRPATPAPRSTTPAIHPQCGHRSRPSSCFPLPGPGPPPFPVADRPSGLGPPIAAPGTPRKIPLIPDLALPSSSLPEQATPHAAPPAPASSHVHFASNSAVYTPRDACTATVHVSSACCT